MRTSVTSVECAPLLFCCSTQEHNSSSSCCNKEKANGCEVDVRAFGGETANLWRVFRLSAQWGAREPIFRFLYNEKYSFVLRTRYIRVRAPARSTMDTFFFSFKSLSLSSSTRKRLYPQRSSGQAVATGVVPFPPRDVPSIFIAHRVQHSHCSSIFIECCKLTLSRFPLIIFYARKSPYEYLYVYSVRIELAKKLILVGTRITYQATGDAGCKIIYLVLGHSTRNGTFKRLDPRHFGCTFIIYNHLRVWAARD